MEVDFGKGVATKRATDADPDSSFFAQNEQANEYMAEKVSYLAKEKDGKFRPFEASSSSKQMTDKKE